jgi:hypothetical protein
VGEALNQISSSKPLNLPSSACEAPPLPLIKDKLCFTICKAEFLWV